MTNQTHKQSHVESATIKTSAESSTVFQKKVLFKRFLCRALGITRTELEFCVNLISRCKTQESFSSVALTELQSD